MVIGYDNKFGKGRVGNANYIKNTTHSCTFLYGLQLIQSTDDHESQ